MAIPKGITLQDVTSAIRDFDAGVPHPYRPSTGYDLIYRDRRYPPKAIVGLAARRLNGGRPLDPITQFSGGEGKSNANRVLRDLDFVVVNKGSAAPATPAGSAGQHWSPREIERVVTAYLTLLRAELTREHVVKRNLTRQLEVALPGRTRRSIEYKFQNISAALYEEGLPWVDGYKPATNYQLALKKAVMDTLDGRAGRRAEIEAAAASVPGDIPAIGSLLAREIPPPLVPLRHAGARGREPRLPTWPGAVRDAANRALGRKGESWVFDSERERLSTEGRDDLAARVEWVATTRGDGLGYDVLSFSAGGEERWIEVKTTNAGPSAPFLLTPNELSVWRMNVAQYRLYRVCSFSSDPRFYRLEGSPSERLLLTTALWEGRPIGSD